MQDITNLLKSNFNLVQDYNQLFSLLTFHNIVFVGFSFTLIYLAANFILSKDPKGSKLLSMSSRFSDMLSLNSVLYQSHNPDRSQYYSDPIYKKQYKKAIKNGGFPAGLQNDGNTCFMNSVLQCLASSNEFMTFINSYTDEEKLTSTNSSPSAVADANNEKDHNNNKSTDFIKSRISSLNSTPFSKALHELLIDLNLPHGERTPTYKTRSLLKVMTDGPNKHLFMGYNQEDAQEFYQSVMKQVEKEFTDLKKVNDAAGEAGENKKTLTDKEKDQLRKKQYVDFSDDLITGISDLGHLGEVFVPVEQLDPADEKNVNKYMPFNLVTPVDGLQCDRIGCIECGEMGGIRYSVTSGLGLNLPIDGANKSRFTLQELIDEWTKKEIIDGVECNRCGLQFMKEKINEKLEVLTSKEVINEKIITMLENRIVQIDNALLKKSISDEVYKSLHSENNVKKSQKVKQSFLARPPPLLCVHINRSVFDPNTFMVKKNPAKIDFPLNLDLSDFTAVSNDINLDGRLEFRKQDENCQPIKESNLKYKLKSVVSHFGTHNYGHYIAFRKHRGFWWRISDEIVRLSTEMEVLNSQGTFMLFYEMANDEDAESIIDGDEDADDGDDNEESDKDEEINPPDPEYEDEEDDAESVSTSKSGDEAQLEQEQAEQDGMINIQANL